MGASGDPDWIFLTLNDRVQEFMKLSPVRDEACRFRMATVTYCAKSPQFLMLQTGPGLVQKNVLCMLRLPELNQFLPRCNSFFVGLSRCLHFTLHKLNVQIKTT